MKKIIYALFVFTLMVSCSDEETGIADTLTVATFYPTIVMEDTEVFITGTAMSQITQVIFPGGKAAKDVQVLDNTRLKVIVPNGVSAEPGTLILKTTDTEIESRQSIRAASPALSYLNPVDVVATYATLSIVGVDLLLADRIQFIGANDEAEVEAMSFTRKSNTQITVNVPADTPLGQNIQVRIVFKNGETMNLGYMKVEKGQQPGGEWQTKEITVYDDGPFAIGSWAAWLTIGSDKFAEVKPDDILRVYFSDPGSNPQGGLRDGGWGDLAEGTNYFNITSGDLSNGYYDWPVDEAVLGKLQSGGVIVGGNNYSVTKVVYLTQVWVEGGGDGSLTDPITENTIMLNDYEPHDGHTASWDMSWADSEATQAVTDDETGNTYIRLVKDLNGWILNCNHINKGTVQDIENYIIKLDILIEDGVTVPTEQGAQWVLGDNWNWVGDGLIPETTNGKWITISTECSALGLSGDLEFGTKTNGLYGNLPAGICFDNLRLDPKD